MVFDSARSADAATGAISRVSARYSLIDTLSVSFTYAKTRQTSDGERMDRWMRFDSAMRALVEFAASRHNAFHTTEAAALGVPQHRLRRAVADGSITTLRSRIWAFPCLGTPPGQAVRAATLATARAAACHHASAWLHGWDESLPAEPQIWVPGSVRPLSGVSLQWARRVDSGHDICTVDGIVTLNQAASLCLIGRVVASQDLGWYLDQFLRTESLRWLTKTLDRLWSPTDCRSGLASLAWLSNRDRLTATTESWLERVVADLLTVADLPPLHTQYPVNVGRRQFRLDLAMPSIKLGIEVHSRTYHWGPGREDADNVRDLAIGSVGWQLLYVTPITAGRSRQVRGHGRGGGPGPSGPSSTDRPDGIALAVRIARRNARYRALLRDVVRPARQQGCIQTGRTLVGTRQHDTQRQESIMKSKIVGGMIAAAAVFGAGTAAVSAAPGNAPDTACMQAGIGVLQDAGLLTAVADDGLPIATDRRRRRDRARRRRHLRCARSNSVQRRVGRSPGRGQQPLRLSLVRLVP